MTTTEDRSPLHLHPRPPRTSRILLIGTAVAVVTAVALPDSTAARWVVAGLAGLTLVAVAIDHRLNGVLVGTGFLLSLGLLRRLLTMVQDDPAEDPLLLVGPVLVVVLVGLFLWDRAAARPSRLLVLVGAFVAVSILGVANTTSVSFRANVEGLIFWTVPMLWFLVGRQLLDGAAARRVLRVAAVVGVASSTAGLYQVLVGLPEWDLRWVLERGYIALGIQGFGTLHPWGFASSATEFAQVASIAFVICALEVWDGLRRRAMPVVALAGAGTLISFAAVVLSSVRAAQLMLLVAVFVVVLASRAFRPVPFVVTSVAVVALLVGGVRALDVQLAGDGAELLVRRSLMALSDPFDPSSSTLRSHIDLTENALRRLDDRPFGEGTGKGTIAAARSDREHFGAENDIGNAALAFGVVGLALVLSITVLGLHASWRRAWLHRSVVTLAILGILVLSLRWWWHGSHYATAMLVWLLLGHVDRSRDDDRATAW